MTQRKSRRKFKPSIPERDRLGRKAPEQEKHLSHKTLCRLIFGRTAAQILEDVSNYHRLGKLRKNRYRKAPPHGRNFSDAWRNTPASQLSRHHPQSQRGKYILLPGGCRYLKFSGHEALFAIRVPEILSPPQPRQQFTVDAVETAVAENGGDIVTATDLILKTSEFLA